MSISAPIIHQGRAITLRRTIPNDAALLYEQMYCNTEFMGLFRLNDVVANEEELRERLVKRWEVSPIKSGYMEMLILHKHHGAIGIIAAADYIALHQRAEFLIGLFDPKYYYAGYSIEACLMVGDLIFNQYKLHRLYAYAYGYNKLAQQALTSGGFMPEGVMKEHLFDQQKEQFVDLHIFGMTVQQFRQNRRIAKLSRRLIGRDITVPLQKRSKGTN